MSKFEFPLMSENFIQEDIDSVHQLLRSTDIFTQSEKVKEFEQAWSDWLGVKYSVFVNSGSSANYLSIRLLKILNGRCA